MNVDQHQPETRPGLKVVCEECGNLSITEAAYRLGFNSSSHFSTAFRRKFGIRPSDLKKT